MNLYEINQSIEDWEPEIDEETGEILNKDELDNLNMLQADKTENIACYIKNLRAESKAISDEIKSQQDRKKAKDNKIKSLERYLLETLNGKTFESSKCKVSYRKSTQLKVNDEEFIEWASDNGLDDLYNVKVTETPDKKKIKDFIKKNGDVPFTELQVKENIQIK